MIENPFKFGSIVEGQYFTDREAETSYVSSVISSSNHLILISPRRYGKSSLVHKVINTTQRPVIALDLQLVTDTHDLAAQLLKRVYKIYPMEKLKNHIRNFRIIPTVTLNPVTNAVDVTFYPNASDQPVLEDVLSLIDNLASQSNKTIVVLDEFQEIMQLDKKLPAQMRSVMQYHNNINYVFLGSQESMMREIFEKKKSPFYHFGLLINLEKIPEFDFMDYLVFRFKKISQQPEQIAKDILAATTCHPYYTQQLAWFTWEICRNNQTDHAPVTTALQQIIAVHDNDYARIWNNFNKTDQKLLMGLVDSTVSALSQSFILKYGLKTTSTAFSSIKRLLAKGYLIRQDNTYSLDDPFFAIWIRQKREQ